VNEGADKKGEEYDHYWKPTGRKYHGSHLELQRTKCGEKKEIEIFP